jgi:ferredoxin
MRILVDNSLCQGHTQCNATAPDIYELDDEGYIAVKSGTTVPAGQEDLARSGAAACPERALTIVE